MSSNQSNHGPTSALLQDNNPVSDQNQPSSLPGKLPGKPKRPCRFLPPEVWRQIRYAYEQDEDKPSPALLSSRFNASRSAIEKRAWSEKWTRFDTFGKKTMQRLSEQNEQIIETATANVSRSIQAQIEKSLAPWLEREKTKHLKSQIKRARLSLKRIDDLTATSKPFTPKDESFIAKSVSDWDNIARRNLGLTDGTVPTGGLSLNILTNHSTVAIKANETETNQK